ncbi:uncharacterized protein LOC112349345 [Selaginella moellendorffii]|uniref:uncharacterized protein LOC112349345 n=1 Tax=Selaginella moellendorffii TaxID=88036 RepID=UPI000D1C9BBD|nr:uncharacterized protein LOC112349345 [Selaginella moellendorffii]|eukprot:XP_024539391.1 uncharacterized protein LOC112349345 [Selaginella moellendorffii]
MTKVKCWPFSWWHALSSLVSNLLQFVLGSNHFSSCISSTNQGLRTILALLAFFLGKVSPDNSTASSVPIVGIIWALALWVFLLLPFLASIGYRKRFDRARTSQPLVFASVWTTAWFLWNRFGGVGALLHPAVSQVTILPLVMSAGVWGMDGIAFLMAWFSAILHDRTVLDESLPKMDKSDKKRATQLHRGHSLAFGAIALSTLFYGSARVSVFSGDFFQKDIALTMKKTVPVSCVLGKLLVYEDMDVMLNRTNQRLRAGDRLVLWSEAAVKLHLKQERDSLQFKAGQIAFQHGAYVGITYEYKDASVGNYFDLVLPDGSIGFTYRKSHLVPLVWNSRGSHSSCHQDRARPDWRSYLLRFRVPRPDAPGREKED